MKNIIILLAALLMPVAVMAKTPSEDLFKKYSTTEGVEITAMAGSVIKSMADNFNLSSYMNLPISKDLIDNVIKSISNVSILKAGTQSAKALATVMEDTKKLFEDAAYTELASLKQNGKTIKLAWLKEKNKIPELIAYNTDDNGITLVSIQGDFTKEQLSDVILQITKMIDVS